MNGTALRQKGPFASAVVAVVVLLAALLPPRGAEAAPASGLTITFTTTATNPSRALDSFATIMRQRLARGGAHGSVVRRDAVLIVHLRDVADPTAAAAQLSRFFSAPVTLQFRPVLANVPPARGGPANPSNTPAVSSAIATCNANQIGQLLSAGADLPTTPLENNDPRNCVILPVRNSKQRLLLAPVTANPTLGVPAGLTGSDISGASSTFQSGQDYAVDVTLTSEGLAKFNGLADASYNASNPGSNAPRDEVAIVLDGLVYSNPAFQTSTFTGPVQITGSYSKSQASDLATVINYGAIPQLKIQSIVVTRT
jgi:preprotein translocase subunit SecD